MRERLGLPNFIFAQAMTIVMLEVMSTVVLKVPIGTFSNTCGHAGAPTRSKIYEENSAPKSIISEARNSHIPTLALNKPVSGRALTVYGISMELASVS